ncbi:MAG: putative integral rane protein [Thermoleophilaceae bacterium]|nr:putative integral rane protein [Thermoleophilaceae bacterium]
MSRYDWLLFLHLIGAFAAVGSVVVFSVLMLGGARVAGAQLTFLARRLWDVGGLLTLVFGIWLALDDYSLGDAWILIALALWAVSAAAGVRLGTAYSETDAPPAARVQPLYGVMAIATTALLVVMIYKPGA